MKAQVFDNFVHDHPWFPAAIAQGIVDLPKLNYPSEEDLRRATKRYFLKHVGTLAWHPLDNLDRDADMGAREDKKYLSGAGGRKLKVGLLEVYHFVGQRDDDSVIVQSIYRNFGQTLYYLQWRGSIKLLAVIKTAYITVERVCDGFSFDVYLPTR